MSEDLGPDRFPLVLLLSNAGSPLWTCLGSPVKAFTLACCFGKLFSVFQNK